MPVVRGQQVFQLFGFLRGPLPGRTNLARSLHDYALGCSPRAGGAHLRLPRPGYAEGLKALAARRLRCRRHHLSDSPRCPELAGDLKLVDAETGEIREISVSQHSSGMRKALEEFCAV